eukprot:2954041-Amphidinium_carterae.1
MKKVTKACSACLATLPDPALQTRSPTSTQGTSCIPEFAMPDLDDVTFEYGVLLSAVPPIELCFGEGKPSKAAECAGELLDDELEEIIAFSPVLAPSITSEGASEHVGLRTVFDPEVPPHCLFDCASYLVRNLCDGPPQHTNQQQLRRITYKILCRLRDSNTTVLGHDLGSVATSLGLTLDEYIDATLSHRAGNTIDAYLVATTFQIPFEMITIDANGEREVFSTASHISNIEA